MYSFNSYTVYDKEGNLLASARSSGVAIGTASADNRVSPMPGPYFDSLPADVKQRADVMLVLQESGFVVRYRVNQLPTLGPRESFSSGA